MIITKFFEILHLKKLSTRSSSYPYTDSHQPNMVHAVAKVGETVIAESDFCETVEGNYYFPASSIDPSFLTTSNTKTGCPWKGTAHYYTLNVDGKELKDAAWYYPEPKEDAVNIKDHVAFYKSKVRVSG